MCREAAGSLHNSMEPDHTTGLARSPGSCLPKPALSAPASLLRHQLDSRKQEQMKSAQNASTTQAASFRGCRLRKMLAAKGQLAFLPKPALSGRPLEAAMFRHLGIECGMVGRRFLMPGIYATTSAQFPLIDCSSCALRSFCMHHAAMTCCALQCRPGGIGWKVARFRRKCDAPFHC